jgi:predicted short-subunit dehydrogenase-like oxidoreductase (DUF2520 family)
MLDTLLTIGADTVVKASTSLVVTMLLSDPVLIREHHKIARASGQADVVSFIKRISALADEARRDTGRLPPKEPDDNPDH